MAGRLSHLVCTVCTESYIPNAQIHKLPGIIRVGAVVTTKHMEIQPSGKHFLDQVLAIQAPRSNALTHQEELSCVAASTGPPEMETKHNAISLLSSHVLLISLEPPLRAPTKTVHSIGCTSLHAAHGSLLIKLIKH